MPAGSPSNATGPTPEVSVILATFNERENLPPLLERLWAVSLPPVEVIVVDDGSTDGTREFLEAAALREPRLRLIWHDGKQTTLRAQCQGIRDSGIPDGAGAQGYFGAGGRGVISSRLF